MTDTVTELFPREVEINEEIVEKLEALLSLAKEGRIHSLAYAALKDGALRFDSAVRTNMELAQLIGAIEALKFDLMAEMIDA